MIHSSHLWTCRPGDGTLLDDSSIWWIATRSVSLTSAFTHLSALTSRFCARCGRGCGSFTPTTAHVFQESLDPHGCATLCAASRSISTTRFLPSVILPTEHSARTAIRDSPGASCL